jgi:nitric oxide reductase NorE protein
MYSQNGKEDSIMSTANIQMTGVSQRRLTGESGMWVVIFGVMIEFSVYFILYVYYRAQNVELFLQSQQTLNQYFGVINTVVLVTSSWFVAAAVHAAREGLAKIVRGGFIAAFLCGTLFCAIKFFEYEEKVRAGIMVDASEFFHFYYTYTYLHLFHVLVGMGLLAFVWNYHSRKEVLELRDIQRIELGASFWHLVDLIWLVLFALFYLVK